MPQEGSTLFAYIDEYGNPDLDVGKEGASDYFICVAVLVSDSQRDLTEAGVIGISKSSFSGGEIKSSNIGRNDKRRMKVLEELTKLEFSYFALVVDKRRISKDAGIRFKPVFYKYINRILYRNLWNNYGDLKVVADRIGGNRFMRTFQSYMERHQMPNLITNYSHRFSDSAKEPLIQVADLIVGTLARIFDPVLRCAEGPSFHSLLRPHEIGIQAWPPNYRRRSDEVQDGEGEWDTTIAESVLNQSIRFLKEHEDSQDENRQMQVATLSHLLYLHDFEDSIGSLFAAELIAYLFQLGFPELSRQDFSSNVIGPLRDAGIIISGSSSGYRLALSQEDIRLYLDHDLSLITPMISRLQKAREQVKFATRNNLDILDENKYRSLKSVADEFRRIEITDPVGEVEGNL